MKPIVVVGGGGHAKVLISILKKMNEFRIIGYTDLKDNGSLLDVCYLGFDSALGSLATTIKDLNVILAVGQVGLGQQRQLLWSRLQSMPVRFPMIVSPGATLNEGVSGGEGAVVMDGAVVNTGTSIGRGAILNTNSTVEHDVVLKDWVHLGPGSTLSGGVTVGEFSMIGAGATLIEGTKIASCCFVGAGAVVVNDLTEPGLYAGVPARRIK